MSSTTFVPLLGQVIVVAAFATNLVMEITTPAGSGTLVYPTRITNEEDTAENGTASSDETEVVGDDDDALTPSTTGPVASPTEQDRILDSIL